MASDKLQHIKHIDNSETGILPRVDLEPALHREPPPPPLPEITDENEGAKTGEMPIVRDTAEDSKTRDEDKPLGK